MSQFNRNRASTGLWVMRYEDPEAVLSEILEPGYFPPALLQRNDVALVLGSDGFAMVRVISLDEEKRPIFEYARAGPPAASIAHTYRPRRVA